MPLNFDLIETGADLDAATINVPLQQLDNAMTKRNFTAVTNPTTGDDFNDGYGVGSVWVNVTLDRVFVAVDVTVGAAVWREIGAQLNNLTAVAAPTVNDDSADGYSVGSVWVDGANDRSYIAVDVTVGAAVWEGFSYPAATLVVDSGGRLVLGRATSVVSSGSINSILQVLGTNSNAGLLAARFVASALAPQITLAKSRHATVGSHTLVNTGDELGRISFEGSDGDEFHPAANIVVVAAGTPANNVMPGDMQFRTTPAASVTPLTRLTIGNDGRIGIAQAPDATAILGVTGDVEITGRLDVSGVLDANGAVDFASTLTVAGSLFSDGVLVVNHEMILGQTPSSTYMTDGIVLDQETNNDDIMEFQSSSVVAHGATAVADPATYGAASKEANSNGGLRWTGYSMTVAALALEGNSTTDDGTLSTAAVAPIVLRGQKISGTGFGATPSGKNIVVFRSGPGATRFIYTSDGNSYEDGTGWTAYDDYDDAALLELANTALLKTQDPIQHDFWQWAQENASILQELKLISFNEDLHHFVNRSKMQELLVGACRQMGKRIADLEIRVSELSEQKHQRDDGMFYILG